ncbi:uncharacterized protein JCM15063_000548 [Sporobolomyces koalae]|uniref:uncharacterized protein n=1 Tax=Sporobolomyces koalae TaxID=500713 RepID=UPI003174DA61
MREYRAANRKIRELKEILDSLEWPKEGRRSDGYPKWREDADNAVMNGVLNITCISSELNGQKKEVLDMPAELFKEVKEAIEELANGKYEKTEDVPTLLRAVTTKYWVDAMRVATYRIEHGLPEPPLSKANAVIAINDLTIMLVLRSFGKTARRFTLQQYTTYGLVTGWADVSRYIVPNVMNHFKSVTTVEQWGILHNLCYLNELVWKHEHSAFQIWEKIDTELKPAIDKSRGGEVEYLAQFLLKANHHTNATWPKLHPIDPDRLTKSLHALPEETGSPPRPRSRSRSRSPLPSPSDPSSQPEYRTRSPPRGGWTEFAPTSAFRFFSALVYDRIGDLAEILEEFKKGQWPKEESRSDSYSTWRKKADNALENGLRNIACISREQSGPGVEVLDIPAELFKEVKYAIEDLVNDTYASSYDVPWILVVKDTEYCIDAMKAATNCMKPGMPNRPCSKANAVFAIQDIAITLVLQAVGKLEGRCTLEQHTAHKQDADWADFSRYLVQIVMEHFKSVTTVEQWGIVHDLRYLAEIVNENLDASQLWKQVVIELRLALREKRKIDIRPTRVRGETLPWLTPALSALHLHASPDARSVAMHDSDEFDHYLSDNDLDFESIDLLEQSINSVTPTATPAPVGVSLGHVAPTTRTAASTPGSTRPPGHVAAPHIVQRLPLPLPLPQQSQRIVPPRGVRPSASFLRPPKPPPRQSKSSVSVPHRAPSPVPPPPHSQAALAANIGQVKEQPPPPKRRRVSLNEQGNEGYVDPNPFNKPLPIPEEPTIGGTRAPGVGETAEEEYVEENMPEIRLKQGADGKVLGYEVEPQRGTTVFPKESHTDPRLRSTETSSGTTKLVRRATGQRNLSSDSGPKAMAGPEVARDSSSTASAINPQAKGMSDAEIRELEELRRERIRLQAALNTSQQEQQRAKEELLAKVGESSVIRNRMNKAEAAHSLAMKDQQREREKLELALRAKEQELHNELERIKTIEAFRQIEQPNVHSSARKSVQRNRNGAPRSTQRADRTRGVSVATPRGGRDVSESPSIGRGREERGSPARARASPQRQAPSFAGFHNSFSESPGPAPGRRIEREGSMAPPPFPMTGGKTRRYAANKLNGDAPNDSGKRRMMAEEDESFFSEGHGGMINPSFGVSGAQTMDKVTEMDDEDEGEEAEDSEWEWVEEERDWRGEILAVIFSHTTPTTIDTTSALPFTGTTSATQLRSTVVPNATGAFSRSFAYSATARSATSTGRSFGGANSRQNSLGGSSMSTTSPASTAPGPPVPTFHSLMNLHFPPSTASALTSSYESETRNLFTLLGRRLDPRLTPTIPNSPQVGYAEHADPLASTIQLCSDLSQSFQALLVILDQAGLIGPITALLSLINHLVFLFPPFALSLLSDSIPPQGSDTSTPSRKGGLLAILAKLITRYGKHVAPQPTPASSTAQSARTGEKRSLAFQSRRSKQASRNAASRTGGSKKKGIEEGEEDRILIEDSDKRDALLCSMTGIVEGLAWRWTVEEAKSSRNAQDCFQTFLQTPQTVSTLLDPNQPLQILLSTTRILALLANHSCMYRSILALRLADAHDVRGSPLPIFERIATLLNLQPREGSFATRVFDLHSSLLSLSTTLLSHQPDSIRLIAESPRFIPEGLLKRIYRDVETLWEWDGRTVSSTGQVRTLLNHTTQRLYSTMTLLYYLLFAPHSSLSLPTVFRNSVTTFRTTTTNDSTRSSNSSSSSHLATYVQDWCSVALGTLAFTEGVPSWVITPESESSEIDPQEEEEQTFTRLKDDPGSRLIDLRYLAQEILEEMLPEELEGIGECFGLVEEEEDEEEEEEEDDARADERFEQDKEGNR